MAAHVFSAARVLTGLPHPDEGVFVADYRNAAGRRAVVLHVVPRGKLVAHAVDSSGELPHESLGAAAVDCSPWADFIARYKLDLHSVVDAANRCAPGAW